MRFRDVLSKVAHAASYSSLFLCLFLAVLLLPTLSQASGFVCASVDQDTKIIVHFDANPAPDDSGPRALKMIMLDPTVSVRNQLIAQFSSADGLLNNSRGVIVAYVDLNHPDSSRRGERVGGTVLGALSSIILEIDYAYEEPLAEGEQFSGQVVYLKRNGKELTQDFDCTHFKSLEFQRALLEE